MSFKINCNSGLGWDYKREIEKIPNVSFVPCLNLDDIAKSDICVFGAWGGWKPNYLHAQEIMEIGYAYALKKPVFILTQTKIIDDGSEKGLLANLYRATIMHQTIQPLREYIEREAAKRRV